MLSDPLYLQAANGDVQYNLTSIEGSKAIRVRADTVDTSSGTVAIRGTHTVSHDVNAKTGRTRSVMRVDTIFVDSSFGTDEQSVACYLVLDRETVPSTPVTTAAMIKSAIAQILSFFATDPTAASPSSVPLTISTSNGVKFLAGEP